MRVHFGRLLSTRTLSFQCKQRTSIHAGSRISHSLQFHTEVGKMWLEVTVVTGYLCELSVKLKAEGRRVI